MGRTQRRSGRSVVTEGACKTIADAMYRLNQTRAMRVALQLLAQVQDVPIQDVGVAGEVCAPKCIENLVPPQNARSLLHKYSQQIEFSRREVDRDTSSQNRARSPVQRH